MSSPGRIIIEQRRGLLQITVWENEGEKGPFFTATLKRSYKEGNEWKEIKMSLPLRDFLQMARMLEFANDAVYGEIDVQRNSRQEHAEPQADAPPSQFVVTGVDAIAGQPEGDMPF